MALVARNITGTVKRADGEAVANARIFIKPVRVFGDAGVIAPSGVFHVDADGNGEADFNLLTSDAENAFVRYEMTLPGSLPFRFDLVNGEPTTIDDLYNLAAASGGSDMASLEVLINAAKRPYKTFVATIRLDAQGETFEVSHVLENSLGEFSAYWDGDSSFGAIEFPGYSFDSLFTASRLAFFISTGFSVDGQPTSALAQGDGTKILFGQPSGMGYIEDVAVEVRVYDA